MTTRSSVKYEVKERVLCYEPDPTKAKVIYDAKILKIVDENNEKAFLVHFQGWSSTWDRFVAHDCLLKSNEENKNLQKRLFEEAADEESQRRKSKNKRKKLEEEAKSDDEEGQDENNQPPKQQQQHQQQQQQQPREVELVLPEALKRHLEKDEQFCRSSRSNARKLFSKVPNLTVIDVLEGFLRHFAAMKLTQHDRLHGRLSASVSAAREKKLKAKDHLERVDNSVSVCKEVVESLRVIFDMYFEKILMYNNEKVNFKALTSKTPTLIAALENTQDKTPSKIQMSINKLEDIAKFGAESGQSSSVAGSGKSTPATSISSSFSSFSRANSITNINSWKLLAAAKPKTVRPALASSICSPVHLLRLLVKMPLIISKMNMNVWKEKMILKYLEHLIDYLVNSEHFFTELYQ